MILEKERAHEDGGVAQLGEHLPCKQGVMGSIPIISTSRQCRHPIIGGSLIKLHASYPDGFMQNRFWIKNGRDNGKRPARF